MLRLCSLGSGSGGNALVVEVSEGLTSTRILIDSGFNLRQLRQRLGRVGLAVGELDAVFVTHEHSDHAAGVAALARKHGVAVYCTDGTASACRFRELDVAWHRIEAGRAVALGALRVEPYAVPHDADEPVQFTFSDGDRRAGLLTDAGACTVAMIEALNGLHALILECNHDAVMLENGAYPVFLKRRIAGDRGHLSNDQAAEILRQIDCGHLAWVAAAHLSAANNRRELAQGALAAALACALADVAVLDQATGLDWRRV